MRPVPAPPIPRIAEKLGLKNTRYLPPFGGREERWVNRQRDLFRRHNPVYACDNPRKMTGYNTRVQFNQRNMTAFGGLFLPLLFAERLGLREPLRRALNHEGLVYGTDDLLLSSVASILAGAPRLYDINVIRRDKGLAAALGLEQLPEEGNLRKKLACASAEELEAMEQVNATLFEKTNRTEDATTVGIDLDLTTVTVYGKQEGSEVGYNPKKPGRRCYQIAVCFLANNGDALTAELRPGNTVASTDFERFWQKILSKLPSNYKVAVVRMDKGYFGDRIFRVLEASPDIFYISGAPARNVLVAWARENLRFKPVSRSAESEEEQNGVRYFLAEGMYAFQTWEAPRRFVVVKKLTPNPDYDPDRVMVDIFGEPLVPPFLEEYTFYVTNFSPEQLDAEGVWHFYNERGTVENRVKESRLGFALDKLPSHNFFGNAIYVQLVFFAYNLLNAFKRFLLPLEYQRKNIRWLRMHLLRLPALVTRKKLQWVVKFPIWILDRRLVERPLRLLAEGKPYYVV